MDEKWRNFIIMGAVGAVGLAPVADFVQNNIQDNKRLPVPDYCSIYFTEKNNDLYKVFFQQPQFASSTATANFALNI